MQGKVKKMLAKINRSKLMNNTQRVLFDMLMSKTEWVSRKQLRVPSASSRVRDLRTKDFGSFQVECATAKQLKRNSRKLSGNRPTFYRLDPKSITPKRVAKVFEGVIATR